MLAKRDQWLEYTNDDATPAMAEQALVRMMTADIQAAADVLTPARQKVLMPIARYAASNLACDEPIALLHDWETPVPAKAEALAMWRALCCLLLTGRDHKGGFRKRLDKNMGLPATDEAKPYKEQLLAFIE